MLSHVDFEGDHPLDVAELEEDYRKQLLINSVLWEALHQIREAANEEHFNPIGRLPSIIDQALAYAEFAIDEGICAVELRVA